jgi:hypothetical protein
MFEVMSKKARSAVTNTMRDSDQGSSRHQSAMTIWAPRRLVKSSTARHPSRSLALNDSIHAFRQGDPGSMECVPARDVVHQLLTVVEI